MRVGLLVFTAGQAALNAAGELVGANDIRVQTKKTLENIRGVLEGLSATMEDVVKVTVWLKDYDDYAGMNEVYANVIGPCIVTADEVDPQNLGMILRVNGEVWTNES